MVTRRVRESVKYEIWHSGFQKLFTAALLCTSDLRACTILGL